MRKPTIILAVLAVVLLGFADVAQAGQETTVAAAVGGTFPPGATFNGVAIQGLEGGFGLEIEDGTALGQFTVVLLGLGIGGVEQRIVVTGQAQAGSQSAANVATFSGTCSVDMGVTGSQLLLNVPFTATVTTDANDQGTLGLVINSQTLPTAVVNAGSMTISVPPVTTP